MESVPSTLEELLDIEPNINGVNMLATENGETDINHSEEFEERAETAVDSEAVEETEAFEERAETAVDSEAVEETEAFEEPETFEETEATEETETTEENQQEEEPTRMKLTELPISRVRNIIKTDPEINLVNQEAVFLITKATELFIDSLSKESYKYTHQAKKKTIQKQDIQSAIDNVDALVFLDGI